MSYLPAVANGDITGTLPGTLAIGLNKVSPAKLAVADPDGLGALSVIRKSFAAGGATTVPIYSANAPFGFRVVMTKLLVSTAIALATVQLKDGAATPLTDLWSAAVVGSIIDLPAGSLVATATIAAGGTLNIVRSVNTVAGEVIIVIEKI